ncbi:MAG: TonB-dependent receptor [Myxococcota bacterium]|nr:TonB-dependent receptor [Myxococcota bacterium]
MGYGDHDATHATVWATGREGGTGYRLSAGYDHWPRWSREIPPGRADVHLFTGDQDTAQRTVRLDATITHQLGAKATAGIRGGYNQGSFELLAIGPINDHILSPVQTSDLAVFLESKHVVLHAFWNRIDVVEGNNAAYLGQSLLPARALTDVADGEAQIVGQFETGRGVLHDLHVGIAYRLKAVEWTYQAQSQAEHHAGFFLHDEMKVGPHVALVGDYRADYVPYLNRVVQSARGSLLFQPSTRSTLRAMVGSAFRTPTLLEAYLGLPVPLRVTGAALVSEGIRSDQRSFRLEPEQIITTEIGYLNSDNDFFTLDGALFYDRASNLIDLAPNRAVTLGDVVSSPQATTPNPSTGLYPFFLGGFENQCQIYDVVGAELGMRAFPMQGLDVYANYTLMAVKQNDDRCRAEQLALLATDSRTSAHKINAGVQVRSGVGIEASLDFHYVSPQSWAEQVEDIQKQRIEYRSFRLDGYALLNARIAYRFLHNQAELSGVAFNLLDERHREHPFGQVIGRRLMGLLSVRF